MVDGIAQDALQTFGAVIIQGPRAVGKTTSGLHLAASSVRLDSDPHLPALAETSPQTVLSGPIPRLLDEWQLAPSLWNAVRHEVDKRTEPGQFILTGSATPPDDLTRHSGAGRFRRITLRPMSLLESRETTGQITLADLFAGTDIAGLGGPTVPEYAELIVRGGWPALVSGPRRSPSDYLNAYLDDVTRVDLPMTAGRPDPMRVRALIRALARNVSTELSMAKLGREAEIGDDNSAIPGQTVRKYLDALSRVFVVEEQPAWAPHLRSKVRLRTHPKWHFVDPSLAAVALGASPSALLEDLNTLGLLFESLCIRDLRIHAQPLGGSVFHYRDENGLEIDAIVELFDGRWAAFEIKIGGTANIDNAAKNLTALKSKISEKRANQLASLNVLTAGSTSYTRPDGINVVSLGHLGRST